MPISSPSSSNVLGPVGSPSGGEFHPGRSVAVTYRFDLLDASDMSAIGTLPASSKSFDMDLLSWGLNQASFSIPLEHALAYELYPIKTAVRIVRNGVIIASGMVWNIDSRGSSGMVQVTVAGWNQLLNFRELRQAKSYTDDDAADIIEDLIDTVNAQTDAATPTPNVRPMWVTSGTKQASVNRTRKYEVGQNLGAAIQELNTIESGVDIVIDPVTRALNVLAARGSNLTEVKFGYRSWPANLLDAGETFDTGETVNRFTARGRGVPQFAEDRDAMDFLGQMLERSESLDVPDTAVLLAYAGGEVVYRALPPLHYSIQPMPYDGTHRVPEPFVDYDLGDTVYFSANHGRIQVNNQAVRVFGIAINVDDESNEIITGLRVRA